MRKIILVTVLALALTAGYTGARFMASEMMSKSGETAESGNLLGAPVIDSRGENLGTIGDIVAGPEGRAGFALLNYWMSDDTQKRIAVPFGALSCEGQRCVLNGSRDTLDSAPVFASEDDLAGTKTAEDIYRYFGVQPYWTEEK